MSRERRPSKEKRINPHYWVFCEGKTEAAYVRYLRSRYRIPIEIVHKVAGSDISDKYIERFKRGKPTHEKDKNFLFYDADVKEVFERLKKNKTAELLCSNPSIELWFLLHYKNQKFSIKESTCIQELCNRNKNEYKKGVIDRKLKAKLDSKYLKAIERAKGLSYPENPSTNIYIFIEMLEKFQKEYKSP